MSPDLPGVELGGLAQGLEPVFVVDASADGARAVSHLQSLGYEVFQVPLQLLVERVAVQRPSLIVCNADVPGALAVAQQVRAIPGTRRIHVLYVGTSGQTLKDDADAEFHEGSAFLSLPLSCDQLANRAVELMGRVAQSEPSLAPESHGHPSAGPASSGNRASRPSLRSAPTPSRIPPGSLPPSAGDSKTSSRAPQGTPSVKVPVAVLSPAQSEEEVGAQAKAAVSSVSPSLAKLLEEAEARISVRPQSARPSSDSPARLSPEQEIDAILSEEMLRALDEPLLDDEDEDDVAGTGTPTGSTGGTRSGSSAGTGSETGAHDELTSETAQRRTYTGSRDTPTPDSSPSPPADVHDRRTTAPPPEPRSRGFGPLGASAPDRRASPSSSFDEEPSTPPPRARAPKPLLTASAVLPPSSIPPSSSWEERTGRLPFRGALKHVSADPMEQPPSSESATLTPRTAAAQPGPPARRVGHDPAVDPWTSTSGTGTTTPVQGLAPAISRPPAPRSDPPITPRVPSTLGPGEVVRAVARAIRARFNGALALEDGAGVRRIVFHEGDFVTVGSGLEQESLVAFLVHRGDLPPEAARLARTLPQFGRHAGAALIAHGHLRQDELWTVLRAHAEWLLGRAFGIQRCGASLEKQLAARLQAEPSVFGGATGAEILVDVARRVVGSEQAILRLLGPSARLSQGSDWQLLSECNLVDSELDAVLKAPGLTVAEVLGRVGTRDFAAALGALVELGVLQSERAPQAHPQDWEARDEDDRLDDARVRTRIKLRRAIVDEGDYFTLLGVSRQATSYEIRHAYLQLRREFSPDVLLTARTADLREDVDVILEVLQEAYEILKDENRRRRYRRALDASGG